MITLLVALDSTSAATGWIFEVSDWTLVPTDLIAVLIGLIFAAVDSIPGGAGLKLGRIG